MDKPAWKGRLVESGRTFIRDRPANGLSAGVAAEFGEVRMNTIAFRARIVGGVSAAALMSVSGQAQAQVSGQQQASDEQADAPAASSGEGQLEAIVVTAQRRTENVQDVPIAITAVSNTRLEAANVQNLQQLNVVVSGVASRENTGAATTYIRGIGTTASNVENPVALYVDGVYIANQRESGIDLIDVEQINVLKGPQGTLFGRNATGGVVQVSTRDPGFDFDAEVKTGIDNYATWRSSAWLGGGLSETVRASLAVQYVDQGDGWGENQTTGKDTYKINHSVNVRGKLLFDLGPATELRLRGDYQDSSNSMSPNFVPFPGTPLTPGFPEGGDLQDPYGWVEEEITLESGGASATFRHEFEDVEVTTITSYREGRNTFLFDPNATPDPRQAIFGITDFDNFSQELQLSNIASDGFQWVVGAFYFLNTVKANPLNVDFFGPLAPEPDSTKQIRIFGDEDTESLAGFAQATIPLTDATDVTGGLRYTWEKRDFFGRLEATLVNGVEIPSLGPPVDDSISANSWTWRLALDHEFSDDLMAYASWNRGFKSGGFNVTTPSNPAYDPETLDAYEIGMKSELLDRQLRFNVGAFYYDYTNIQVARFLQNSTVVQNGAKAELYGVDIDVEANITDRFFATAGISVLDAKFESFPDAVFAFPADGGGLSLVNGDAAGNWLPYAQPFQATVSLNYDVDTSFGSLLFNLTNSYSDGFFPEANNQVKQDAYNLLGVSVTWDSPMEDYYVRLWGSNLLDEKVLSTLNTSASGFVSTYATPPLRFGATVGLRFW